MADLKYYCPKCGNECIIRSRTKGKSRKTAIKCDDCGNFTIKFDGDMYYVVGDEYLPYIVGNPSTVLFHKFENLHEDEFEDSEDYKEFADTAVSIIDLCAGYYDYHNVTINVLERMCDVCRDGMDRGFDLGDAMIYGLSLISATHNREEAEEDIREAIDIAKDIGHSTEHLKTLIDCAIITSYDYFEDDIDILVDMWLEDASPEEDGIPAGLTFYERLIKVLSMFGDDRSLKRNLAKAIEESKRHMDEAMTEDIVAVISNFYYDALQQSESEEEEEQLFNELFAFTEENNDVAPLSYFLCILRGYDNGYCDDDDLDIILRAYEETKDPDYIFYCVQVLIVKSNNDESYLDELFDFILAHRLEDPEKKGLYISLLAVYIESCANDPVKHKDALSKVKENGLSKKDLDKAMRESKSEIRKMLQSFSDDDILKLMKMRKM